MYMFLLVTILLFIIVIICYHYSKHRSNKKNLGTLTISLKRKMTNKKRLVLKIVYVIISMT